MRRGSIKHDDAFVVAENNNFGDSMVVSLSAIIMEREVVGKGKWC